MCVCVCVWAVDVVVAMVTGRGKEHSGLTLAAAAAWIFQCVFVCVCVWCSESFSLTDPCLSESCSHSRQTLLFSLSQTRMRCSWIWCNPESRECRSSSSKRCMYVRTAHDPQDHICRVQEHEYFIAAFLWTFSSREQWLILHFISFTAFWLVLMTSYTVRDLLVDEKRLSRPKLVLGG